MATIIDVPSNFCIPQMEAVELLCEHTDRMRRVTEAVCNRRADMMGAVSITIRVTVTKEKELWPKPIRGG